MDDRRFDALTRAFARGASRRTAIKGLFGGAVGVAVASTRLNPAGAQRTCTPDTVLADCPLPDTCTTATCEPSGEAYYCAYRTCPGGICCNGVCQTECCDASHCGACETCNGGFCEYACSDCARCEGGACIPKTSGICCGGVWHEGGQCCTVDDCVDPDATFCSSVACQDYLCTVVPECPQGQLCCNYGEEEAYCANCCDDGDCTADACGYCDLYGVCQYTQCCYPERPCPTACHLCATGTCVNTCKEDEECCGEDCVPIGTCCDGWGESCSYDEVAGADNQQSCCDGLLCCDSGKGGHACYECCGDWNCDKGLVCSDGLCVQCGDDSHCGKGEICCSGQCVYGECCSVLPAGVEAAGEVVHVCGPCEACYENWCRSTCDNDEVCCATESGYFECVSESKGCCGLAGDWCEVLAAADNLNGACCDGLNCCYDDKSKSGYCAECCGDWDCEGGYCCGGVCQAECCDDKDCEWGVCISGHCFECRDDSGCGKGETCCDGSCGPWECCGYGDDIHCGDCGWCGENYQCYELAGYGEHCEVVLAADGSPEGNCCHGLVCCEWDKGNVCAECCGDWDCPTGCECDHGVCSCHCGSDYDCPKGTCCCKSGACSVDCCPKPPKPQPKPDAPVTTLPATGSGDTAQSSGLLGAVALGAAAAVFAAKRLRETPTEE